MADMGFQAFLNSQGGASFPTSQYSQSLPQYSGSFQDFMNQYQQVQQANQQLSQQSAFQRTVDGLSGSRRPFDLSGGTDSLYNNKYRSANALDTLAIEALKGGEFWNNLPGQIAGAIGGDQARQDWTFDASKFDLSNGFDAEDLNQVKNFATSLPGMMIGGIFEGLGKGYEALTGAPVQEYRNKEGGGYEIADYQLDASQRAATGIDAAINLLGTFAGGAGRVVGAGGKAAAKAASGLSKNAVEAIGKYEAGQMAATDLAGILSKEGFGNGAESIAKATNKLKEARARQSKVEGMSKGVVTRAFEGARGGKKLGTAAGIFADMGDEAAEEFVQSYADDVRMKNIDEGSLDRAITGAAWGAAGGLLMGAGGRALSKISSLGENAEPATQTPSIPDYSSQSDYDSLRDSSDGFYWNTDARDHIDEVNHKSRRATAAAIYKMTSTDTSLGVGETDIGVWNVKKIFEQGEQDAEYLAQSLGTDVDTLRTILYSSNNIANELNALKSRLPQGMQVAIGRNPDTKNGGFLTSVRNFVDGEGLSLHPAVAAVVGADWDGDTCSVYFNPNRLNDMDGENRGNVFAPPGYFSEIMFDPESGKSNFDWIWAGITGDAKADMDRISTILVDKLGPYGAMTVDAGEGRSYSLLEATKKDLEEAFAKQSTGERDAALSQAFGKLISRVNSFDKDKGRIVSEDILNSILKDEAAMVRSVVSVVADSATRDVLQSLGIDPSSPDYADKADQLRKDAIADWETRGTTGGQEKIFQLSKSLGLLTYLANPKAKYNPVYRQYGGLKFYANSVPALSSMITSAATAYGVEPVGMNLIRSAFRLAQPGIDPTRAVESICDRLAIAEISNDLGLASRKLTDESDFNAFKKECVEVLSKFARIYNTAQKEPTSGGLEAIRDSAYRNPIDGIEEVKNGEYRIPFTGELSSEQELAFWRQFHRIFEERPLSDLFDSNILDALGAYPGMTFGDYFDTVARFATAESYSSSLQVLRAKNPAAAEFLESAARTYGNDRTAVRKALENDISDPQINAALDGARARYKANGNKIDPKDLPMLLDYMNMVWRLVGPDNAASLNLLLSNDMFGSELGNALFSSDPKMRMNAIASLGFYGQYELAVDMLVNGDEVAQKNAREDIEALGTISPLHSLVSSQLLLEDEPNRETLDWVASMSISYQEKVDYYDMLLDDVVLGGSGNFLLNCLQCEDGRFAVSSVSAKNKRAESAKLSMVKKSWENSEKEVKDLFVYVDSFNSNGRSPSSLLEGWFKDRTKGSVLKLRSDLLAIKVQASLTGATDYVEKATIPELYSMLYNAAELQRAGALFGTLDQLTSLSHGHVNKSQFLGNREFLLACLSDPEFEMWVFDEDLHKNTLVSQEALFNSVPSIKNSGGFKKGSDPTAAQIKALLEFYPHIATYLCTSGINITTQNGEVATQAARAKSLKDDFESWATPKTVIPEGKTREDLERSNNVNRMIENIRSTYYDDVNAQHVILAIAVHDNPGLLDGHIDSRKLTKAIDDAATKYARFQAYLAIQRRSGISSPLTAKTDIAMSQRRLASEAQELWSALGEVLEKVEFETSEEIARAISEEVLGQFAMVSVADNLRNNYGIESIISDEPDGLGVNVSSISEVMRDGMVIIRWLVDQNLDLLDSSMNELLGQYLDYGKMANSIANTLRANKISELKDEELKKPENERRSYEDIVNEVNRDVSYDEDAETRLYDALSDDSYFSKIRESESYKSMKGILLSDSDFSSRDDAEARMRSLLEASNTYVQSFDDDGNLVYKDIDSIVKEDLASLFDNDGTIKVRERDRIIDVYNKIYMRHLLVDLSAKAGGLGINENALQLADQLDESIDKSVEYLLSSINEGKLPANTLTYNVDQIELEFKNQGIDWSVLPAMSYSSEVLQSSITNQMSADPAAGNAMKVGVSGAQQAQTFPTAHLPAKIDDVSYSYISRIPKSTIMANMVRYKNIYAMIPTSQTPVLMGSKEFYDYVSEIDPSEAIAVFEPTLNPHGLPTYNMGSSFGMPGNVHEYHRLSAILGRIADYSMEQMVMKTKKLLRSVSQLSKADLNVGYRQSSSIATVDSSKLLESCSGLFFKYREEMTKEMTTIFESDDMKAIGFGRDQALILTQALTPGVLLEVEYAEPDPITGKAYGMVMVDASVFFEDVIGNTPAAKFDSIISDHVPPIVSVNKAEVVSVTLQELGSRIMDVEMTAPNAMKNMTPREKESLAVKALSDWGDYAYSYDGDISDLMFQFPPLGRMSRTPVPSIDSAVAPQVVAGLTTEGAFGNWVHGGRKVEHKTLSVGTDAFKFATSQGELLGFVRKAAKGEKKVGFEITKCWYRDVDRSGLASSEAFFDARLQTVAGNINGPSSPLSGDYDFSVGVCTDPDSIAEAKEWAKAHSCKVLFDANIASGMFFPGNPQTIFTSVKDTNGRSIKKKFVVYDGYTAARNDLMHSATVESSWRRASKDSIWLTAVFDSEKRMPAGHEELRTGDANRVLFKRGQSYRVRVPNGFQTVPLSTVFSFNESGERTFISGENIKKLLRKVAVEDNGHWKPRSWDAFEAEGFKTNDYVKNSLDDPRWDEGLRQKIVEYLVYASSFEDTRFISGDPKSGNVAGLITNGNTIVPVFYPRNMPKDIIFNSVTIDGAMDIVFNFGGERTLGDASQKMNTHGAPSKGMTMNSDENPGLVRTRGQSPIAIHDAQMSESETSRFMGAEKRALVNLMPRLRAVNGSNIFFNVSDDGVVEFSEAVKDWPIEDKKMLASGYATFENLFNKVIAGKLTLSKDKHQNDVIIKVFKSLKNRGRINPLLFCGDVIVEGSVNENGELENARAKTVMVNANDVNGYWEFDFQNIFQDIEYPDILSFYNAIDPELCANGYTDSRDRSEYLVSMAGSVRVLWDDGSEYEMFVRAGGPEVLGDYTEEGVPSGSASVSPQHIGRRADDIGYDKRTMQKGFVDNLIQTRRYDEALAEQRKKAVKAYSRDRKFPKYSSQRGIAIASLFPGASKADIRETKAVSSLIGKTFGRGSRSIKKTDGTEVNNLGKDLEGTELGISVGKLRDIMKPGSQDLLSVEIIDSLSKCASGASWSEDMSAIVDENGRWAESEGSVADDIDLIVANLKAGKLPVVADKNGGETANGRIGMAALLPSIARFIWDYIDETALGVDFQTRYHNNFNEFKQAMVEEQKRIEQDNISRIPENTIAGSARKVALTRMSRALLLCYGETSTILPVTGQISFRKLATDQRNIVSTFAAAEKWTSDQIAVFERCLEMDNESWEIMRKHLEEIGYLQVKTGNAGAVNTIGYNRIQEAKDIANLLDNLAETSKVMAVLNPFLTVGNVSDRMFHQGAARLWLWLGNSLRIGPYKSKKEHIVHKEIRKMSVESEAAIALYQSMREMEFSNDELILISEMMANKSETELLKFVEDRKAKINATWPGRIKDFAYKAASGGSLGIKTQMETVIDRFVQFAEEAGLDFWFDEVPGRTNEDGSPMTRLEEMLSRPGGFASFMEACLSKDYGSSMVFLQAMNSAKAGDLAQKNAIMMFVNDILRRMPFSKFLVTTCISRFPAYGLNVTGRVLNYILPISSMYRAFIEFASKTKWGKEVGIEAANVHASMKEAIMVDLCKMGVGGTALLLFGISGAIQPPDDERKWGNIDEWLVFGQRAGETWWIEDLLGIALPMACFWKSCTEGKPRFDIIVNGVANACYANPMIRVSDLAEWILNPAESFVSDYNSEIVQFANAKGGPPSIAQYIQANGFSTGLNWLTQFCTPSIIKEWWRSSYSLEKSYKRDWQRSASGAITEAGANGATEYVTYDEAIKKKLALRNPVLAFMFSIGNKSYMPADMPDTVYYDEYQLDSTSELSVSGLEGDERDARVAYLISVLQSYDDMEELANDGFHLDYETLQAVASQVWDNYHGWDDWYNTLQAERQLDYYTVGNGDWNEGQRIVGELKKERDTMKRYWYNFYYEKLKGTPIAQTITTYNRYNTSYATDVYGEVYATGQYRSPFNTLPFMGAPGNATNPEGTAGYENDFNTISAVTGLPLSQRALIPSTSGMVELPEFEDLSATKDGESYSKSYYDRTGSSPSSAVTGNSRSSSGYGSGSGGGGGGGGGSSRGYTPNMYGPSTNLSKANVSRVMNTDRFIKPDEYYLRPDFETKGSREAYKRSDI